MRMNLLKPRFKKAMPVALVPCLKSVQLKIQALQHAVGDVRHQLRPDLCLLSSKCQALIK